MSEEEVQARKLLDSLSKMGLSKTELNIIKKTFETPVFREKLKDSRYAKELLESFETPVFREQFIKDPQIALKRI